MNQLIGPVFAVLLATALTVLSYRFVGYNEGKSEAWKAIWWWVTVIAAVALIVALITTGTVIQRIYS